MPSKHMQRISRPTNTFSAFLQHFDNKPMLAAQALGCKVQALYQWHGVIPITRATDVERVTNGKVTAADVVRDVAERKVAP